MRIYFKGFCPFKKKIENIYLAALNYTENQAENVAVGVCFVDKTEIHKLNKTYRNIDRPTDVLSFPFLDMNYMGKKLSAFESERDPDGQLYLGDIYICKDIAKAQAKQYGHSTKREVCFLALHGLLHLLGYDHVEKEDEKVMMKTSDEVLSQCKINRRRT